MPFEVIVILNEPTDRLRDELARETHGATVVSFRTNLGFGRAVNHAAGLAKSPYLVLLNDDAEVADEWLDTLVETTRRRPKAALVGSAYLHSDGTVQEAGSVIWADGSTAAVADGAPGLESWDHERRVDYCSGGALLVRRTVWQQLGGFDDAFFPAYYEDVDLCLRAAAAGYETWLQPASLVRHVRSASSGSSFRGHIMERAKQVFLDRWEPHLGDRCSPGAVEEAAWRAEGSPLRVLVIDDTLPDPALGSGFGRMADTLAALSEDPGLRVVLHPRWGPPTTPRFLSRNGVRVVRDLESHLAEPGVDYEVVVVSRPHNGEIYKQLLTERLPRARIIYDAEALYYRRLLMQADQAGGETEAQQFRAEADRTRELEHSLSRWADRCVCISETEAAELRAVTDVDVDVVGPRLRSPRPTTADYASRLDIGLVAGWAAGPGSPNCEGLLWFAREVLPLIRARVPGTQVRVTGAGVPSDVRWLEGPSVLFTGHVEDLWRFYDQVRVIVSPTRTGAGVKLKTVEALQHGVPVVSTREAAAGLDLATTTAVTVSDDAEQFAEAVARLLLDPVAWTRVRESTLRTSATSLAEADGVEIWPRIVRDTASLGPRRKDKT